MVEKLKSYIIKAEGYQAQPVRRVYIPQSAAPNEVYAWLCCPRGKGGAQQGEMRPLVIPTITDRCLQALVHLVLEPLVEMNSDKHSYGFRKYRSAKMAVGRLFFVLTHQLQAGDRGSSSALRRLGEAAPPSYFTCNEGASPLLHPRLPLPLLALPDEKKPISSEADSLPVPVYYYVLDADIKGFFDKISQEWLLNHVPLERTLMLILRGWLKAGTIYKDQEVEYGVSGTPQGGILSPLLSNIYLNELDRFMEILCEQYQGDVKPSTSYRKKNPVANKLLRYGNKSDYYRLRIPSRIHNEIGYRNCKYIRYADDFVIGILGPRQIALEIRDKVKDYLKQELNVELSLEKTKITHITEGIEFLGYIFSRRQLFVKQSYGGTVVTRKMTIPTLDVNMKRVIARLSDANFCEGDGNPVPAFRFLRFPQSYVNARVNYILRGLSE